MQKPVQLLTERVVKAREIQAKRFENYKGVYANAQMPSRMVRKFVP